MKRNERDRAANSMVWGIVLIALGGAYLLDRLGLIEVPSLGSLWPAVFLVIALANAVGGRFGSALTNLLIGTWLFACEFNWYGLRYSNSWPLLLVAIGAGIVVRALGGESWRCRREGGETS